MTMLNLLAAAEAAVTAGIGGNLHIALAALGATLGIAWIGSKAAESTGRNPSAGGEILKNSIVLAALIEGALIIAILLGLLG